MDTGGTKAGKVTIFGNKICHFNTLWHRVRNTGAANKPLTVWHAGCKRTGMNNTMTPADAGILAAKQDNRRARKPQLTVDFCTREYVLSHGKEPRGTGKWAFALSRNPQPGDIFWASNFLTLAQAKREARDHYRLLCGALEAEEFVTVYVQP